MSYPIQIDAFFFGEKCDRKFITKVSNSLTKIVSKLLPIFIKKLQVSNFFTIFSLAFFSVPDLALAKKLHKMGLNTNVF